MIWLNWRRFRLQALASALGLALIAGYLLYLGMDIRDAHDAYRSRCADPAACAQAGSQFQSTYTNTLLFLAAGLGLIPVVIGVFWGAPLIARELELGTHRLVWNQSVTRRRWLIGRMAFAGLAAMIVPGLAALLLTWAAFPYDQVDSDRFGTVEFGARNIVPRGETRDPPEPRGPGPASGHMSQAAMSEPGPPGGHRVKSTAQAMNLATSSAVRTRQ